MTALALGSFAHRARFRGAIDAARRDDRRIVGLWSPCAVEIGDVGEAEARPIAWIAIAAGLAAAAMLYGFIWWTAVHAYPFDSGARPLHSWQVFLIAPIEFGALAAGIVGMIAFLVRARLTRLHDGAFDLDEIGRASTDRYVIALACDAGEDGNVALALLARAGAVHSRLVTR
jgi:hypothetical protein